MEPNKNMLIVTGSPRRKGNTELLANAFIKGAEEAGHKVTLFEAGHKKIQGCRACMKCYSKGQACIYNDDFNEMAPLAEAADILVLATPLYWFSFPAQIKAAIDKLFALYVGKRDVKIKACALMVCAETDDMIDFEGIVRSYELIFNYLKWDNSGILLIPNVNLVGDILKTDALDRAEEFGKNI
ncbi:MAG: flavodoxin family protein [Bacteroidales bacterium]|jgi:multimeric flavodoxin WrbA|nr:flavodoxin family protein [Bacteroidales bacterium]